MGDMSLRVTTKTCGPFFDCGGLWGDIMPKQKRLKTKYAGVTFVEGRRADGTVERIYYIRYRRDGKMIEEKAGRQFQDDMTPARAAGIRAKRIEGDQPSNEEQREQMKAAREAEESRWTLSRLWEEYKARHPDLKGIVTDQNRFEKHIEHDLGAKEPRELISLDVDRLRIRLGKGHQAGTVKNVLELLRRIVNFGTKKHLCDGIPFTIEMPRGSKLKTEDLTAEELSRLMLAIEEETNIQAANFMRMALFTGMRRGELFKLQWNHIDFERGFIEIVDPKGGVDQKIPLNESARRVLLSHERTQESPFVFPGRSGKQRVDIKKQVNRIKERAGLPKDFRALHGLRHLYASMLASSGQVDLYTLQRLLTHKSPQMTQRYAHLRDEALRKASNLAGDIIGSIQAKGKNVVNLPERKD